MNDDTGYHCSILNTVYEDKPTKTDDFTYIRTDKCITITVLLIFIGVLLVGLFRLKQFALQIHPSVEPTSQHMSRGALTTPKCKINVSPTGHNTTPVTYSQI